MMKTKNETKSEIFTSLYNKNCKFFFPLKLKDDLCYPLFAAPFQIKILFYQRLACCKS